MLIVECYTISRKRPEPNNVGSRNKTANGSVRHQTNKNNKQNNSSKKSTQTNLENISESFRETRENSLESNIRFQQMSSQPEYIPRQPSVT